MSTLAQVSDEELIAELVARGRLNAHHTVQIRFADFTMKHTMTCHPDLFHCDMHSMIENCYLNNGGLSPWKEGTYIINEKSKELAPA